MRDRYGPEYVNNLYKMVRRQTNLPFICFTDDAYGIMDEIETYPIYPILDENGEVPERYWPAWNKIELFGRSELNQYDKKIFFDLDVIIHGDITPILECDSNFAVCKSVWKEGLFTITPLNSSVMVWKDNQAVYDEWNKNKLFWILKHKGIDRYFAIEKVPFDYLPQVAYSYKKGRSKTDMFDFDENGRCMGWKEGKRAGVFEMFPEMSVAIFHGEPDIDELDPAEHEILNYWG